MFLIDALKELESLILASPEPAAALERAKLAVMTEGANAATDLGLGLDPETPGTASGRVAREG